MEGPSESEKFTSSFKRLARREELGKQIASEKNKGSIRNIIDFARKNFPILEAQVEQLVSGEFAVEPQRIALVENLHSELVREFPDIEGLAILPFGGTISGGAISRKMMGHTDGSDLDWGVLYNGHISKSRLKEINNYTKTHLPDMAAKQGLPPVISSSYINAENFNTKNLESTEEAIGLIKKMDEEEWDPWDNPLLFYLGPSIPSQYNVQNRKLLLEGLSEISIEDHDLWERTVDQLVDSYKQHLRFKPKHVKGTYAVSERDRKLRKTVIELSSKVMPKKMEDLLLSTDVSSSTNNPNS